MINNRNNNGQIEKKYDEDYMKVLAEEYSMNRNIKEISERENIPKVTLYYYIKKYNLNKENRIKTLNENYFSRINSEAKAYLLGFIMADGCVSTSSSHNKKTNRLIISISNKDRNILELLKSQLCCDYEIIDYVPKGSYSKNLMSRIIINSQKICGDLSKHGIVERKTGKEILPKLPKNMYRHFIRGFLDGDGYVTNNGHTIGFVSNEQMLIQIKDKLMEELKTESVATIVPDSRNKPVWYLNYHTQSDIEKIKNYLYKNAHYYLDRKYSKLT